MKNNKCTNDIEDLLGVVLPPESNYQLADIGEVLLYKNYQDRILWIDKDIDDSLYGEMRSIIRWNLDDERNNIPVEERKKIFLIIHSYGGQLDACFSFMDLITKSKTPVVTINFGNCLSAAALILLSGTKGYRYCMPLSTALLHAGSGGNQGSYNQVEAQSKNYRHLVETMRDWVVNHTNIDKKTMGKWKNDEIYLYAEDQLKYGLVDYIVDDLFEVFKKNGLDTPDTTVKEDKPHE